MLTGFASRERRGSGTEGKFALLLHVLTEFAFAQLQRFVKRLVAVTMEAVLARVSNEKDSHSMQPSALWGQRFVLIAVP